MASKIALISGGGRGSGAATAKLAARAGYNVYINDAVDRGSAEQVVADCQALSVQAVSVKADIADPADVEKLFSRCDNLLGPVDLLVNNTGIVGQATTIEALAPDVRSGRSMSMFSARSTALKKPSSACPRQAASSSICHQLRQR